MKKSIIIIATIFVAGVAKSQVGINTANPQGTFHVDGSKDNATSGAPTAAQQANDFIVTSTGAVGVGTASPNNKLEIKSGTTDVSGLRFTNLTSASTTTTPTAAPLGVDANGDVVINSKRKNVLLLSTNAVEGSSVTQASGSGSGYTPGSKVVFGTTIYNQAPDITTATATVAGSTGVVDFTFGPNRTYLIEFSGGWVAGTGNYGRIALCDNSLTGTSTIVSPNAHFEYVTSNAGTVGTGTFAYVVTTGATSKTYSIRVTDGNITTIGNATGTGSYPFVKIQTID